VVTEVLAETGLTPYVVGAMAPGRDLVDATCVAATQDYLRACVDLAAGTVRLVADRVDTKGGSEHGTTTAATTAAASALPTTSVPKLTTTVTR
jgi:hypothetical protein